MAVIQTGLQSVNHKSILELNKSPMIDGGFKADPGSLAMVDDGTAGHAYLKTGLGDTDWMELAFPEGGIWLTAGNIMTGGAPDTPDQLLGSLNDYDTVFTRNAIEQFRLQAGAMLIGLNASMGGRLQISDALGAELLKQISPSGDSTSAVIKVTRQYKVQTTDATPAVAASLAMPASSRVKANFDIGANQKGGTAGAAGDGASYERTISAKALSSGNAILTKVQTDYTEEDTAAKAFDVGFAVNTTNIDLSVTGMLNKNVAWYVHAEIMIYKD